MSDVRQSNEVFSATAPHDQQQHVQGVQQHGDVPVERVPLPSLGRVYVASSPLCDADGIDIRAMTAREEDILTSRALVKNGTVITELLKSCIVDKRIDVREMLVGDRNAVMIGVRITGYGSDYEVETECSECSHRQKSTFDLSSLKLRGLMIEPVAPNTNEFEFRLPVTNVSVRFRFITGADEEDINRQLDRRRGQGFVGDSLVTTRLRRCIVSVSGQTDGAAISRFVQTMRARDSLALRKHIDANEPGVDMRCSVTCQQCGLDEEVQMPLGASFFWPGA